MKKVLLSLSAILVATLSFAQMPDTVRIDSIQWVSASDLANCDDLSRYDGDTVVLTGICIVDGSRYGSQSHNIQVSMTAKPSPFGAIRFRQGDPNANYTSSIRDLKQGDSIITIGVLSQYQGETQFQPLVMNGSVTILNRGIQIQDTVISVGQLNDDKRVNQLATGEQWESSFVTIEDVTVETVDFFSSGSRVSFVVSEDATGALINIGDHFTVQKLPQYTHPVTNKPGKFVPPSPGDKFKSISGIVIHSRNCTGENGRGYELCPFDSSHYKYGPSAPRISNEKRSKSVPTSADDITVSADVDDLDGQIVNAKLYYNTGTDINNTNFTVVPMVKGTGKNYSAVIPKQADGTFVRYYITAEDDSANVSTRPNKDPKLNTFAYRVRDNGLTIFDVQYTPYPGGLSIYLDEDVTVTGVVTSGGKDCDLSLIHIQDENAIGGWSGVLVTNAGTTFERGDKIEVTGTVSEMRTSSSYRTAISNVSNVTKKGTGTIEAALFAPDTIVNGSDLTKEKYESVFVGLINTSTVGNGKLHVVDTNPDSPSNFAEYSVGRDPLDPAKGARVLTGRPGQGSVFVSYVNASTRVPDSSSYAVSKIIVSDTLNMDTLFGIMTETYGNYKLLPRNNKDFAGINANPSLDPCKTTSGEAELTSVKTSFAIYPNPASSFLTVENKEAFDMLKMKIFDLNGREVFVRQTRLQVNELPIGELETGTYILQIETLNGLIQGRTKFIKQ